MAKLKGPLFSVDAHGALGKALTYQRRPGGASVYGYKKPKVPLTIPQQLQRWDIASAVAYWQSLSQAAKDEWEAKAAGQGQSGYSYMVSHYCKLNYDRPLWLPMQEGVGSIVYDRSGHGNHGTISGATWKKLPSGLWYLDFDGTDDLTTHTGTLGLTNQLTIKAWVKADSWKKLNDENDFIEIYRASDTVSVAFFGVLEGATDYPYFRVVGTGGGTGGTGVTPISLATWYHFVATVNLIETVTYVNGVLDKAFTPITGVLRTPQDRITIGRRTSAIYWWDGPIALVRIFNRALNYWEILNSFNRERYLFGV